MNGPLPSSMLKKIEKEHLYSTSVKSATTFSHLDVYPLPTCTCEFSNGYCIQPAQTSPNAPRTGRLGLFQLLQ